jgi:ADP-ribose pyrophosphatase YjhB (NUDIX family)
VLDIFPLLDELQTIARNGLAYSTNPYDRERYQRLLELAGEYYGHTVAVPTAELRKRFAAELGYITPKVGADAAMFDHDGRILLVRRTDDSQWCLPCGWVEPGESPAEAAVRETHEETGLKVEVARLVDVFTRKPNIGYGPHTAIAVVYLCNVLGGELRGSHEGEDVRYQQIDEVQGWHELHELYARAAFSAWQASDGTLRQQVDEEWRQD